MGKITIPFGTTGGKYTDDEIRRKDAVEFETLQRIANALEDISIQLSTINKQEK